MQCPSCHGPISRGARFCPSCGVALLPTCAACGALGALGDRYCAACGHQIAPPLGLADAPAAFVPPVDERRQLTVMFVDMVGSTELATQLDPEELRDLVDRFQQGAAVVVARHGGKVAKLLGDGVLVYFGFPRAHEDDAEQAVRAALMVVESAEEPVLLRIGIATGTVVVGDRLGRDGSRESVVFGETPNLAARLQEAAPPGAVVVCQTTRRLVAGHFVIGDPRAARLKGFSQPVSVSTVQRDSGIAGRFEARHPARAAPLLGRQEELDLLRRRWAQVVTGQGRVVLMTGEPGIGKSRIALALREAVAPDAPWILRFYCSPRHAHSALHPFLDFVERGARLRPNDPAVLRHAKLRAFLEGADEASFASVAALLGVGDDGAVAADTPQRHKAQTFDALLTHIQNRTRQKAVLAVFEDIHWMDPTSLELLVQLVEQTTGRRLFILATSRPEFTAPWPNRAHVATLSLTRLPPHEATALAWQTAGNRLLPPDLVAQLVARADGVPLFVEELTKTLLESGVLVEQDSGLVLEQPLPSLTIPETLQGSLVARLDRLESVREIAQIGAAIGRDFDCELLQVVAGLTRDELARALDTLIAAELLYRSGETGDVIFSFKHSLVRDAAYAGLLKSRRRELHGVIARAIEDQFPERARRAPETIAYHLTEAAQPAAAAGYWLKAGRNAAARSANLEAIAHFRSGLQAVAQLPRDPANARVALDCLFGLGPCLISTQGPASAEAIAAFAEARELCVRLDDAPELPQVMFWIATASVIRGELANADEAVTAMLHALKGEGSERPALLNALRGRAMILLFMGRPADARRSAEQFLELFDASSADDQLAARVAGQDARAAGLAILSWALWLVGEASAADQACQQALGRAEATGHPHTQAYVAYYAAVLHGLRGDAAGMARHAARCEELATAHGFEQWRGLARAVRAICALGQTPQRASEAFAEVREATARYRQSGYQLGMTALDVLFVPLMITAGRLETARELVDGGLAIGDRNGERLFLAELYRLRAAVLEASALEGGEADLLMAIDVARQQKAAVLARRAERDLQALRLSRPLGLAAMSHRTAD